VAVRSLGGAVDYSSLVIVSSTSPPPRPLSTQAD